ncbi:MAG: purine-nucleoside phosphorylase [Candidatus Zixiibacteriota bacterium]
MSELMNQIERSVADIRKQTDFTAEVGIILGTGLGTLADRIDESASVSYEDISHFPVSTVEFHAGRLIFGELAGKKVIAMQGRFHVYEGYTIQQVSYPVRVLRALGVKTLVVSNASGGLNPQFELGEIVLMTDHINLLGGSPLIGVNHDNIGSRFPDMFNCYDKDLAKLAEDCARDEKIKLSKGIYAAVTGPNLETAAEYRYLRIIGADVVGMSTVPEVIAARHQGTRVLGFSIVTDMGVPDAMKAVSVDEILGTAREAEPNLTRLIESVVRRID